MKEDYRHNKKVLSISSSLLSFDEFEKEETRQWRKTWGD